MNVRPHRRRRLVIALLAAVLIVAAARLAHRPVDTRFVGRWNIHYEAANATWPVPSIEFRSDGTATWWSSNVPHNRIYSPSPLRWTMAGEHLIWRMEYESLFEAVCLEYDRFRYRFWDRTAVAPHENAFEIADVSDNEIKLDVIARTKTKYRWTLRRAD